MIIMKNFKKCLNVSLFILFGVIMVIINPLKLGGPTEEYNGISKSVAHTDLTDRKSESETGTDMAVNEIVYETGKEDSNNSYINNQIGYINISGTDISNVIMQTDNNDFYLKHTPDGAYSILGSIYMDYRNTFDDQNILIFGHNARKMANAPFHDLEKYTDYNFYQGHQYIDLELNHVKSRWQIFSVLIVSKKTNKHMRIHFSEQSWQSHLEWLYQNSIYDTGIKLTNNDRILTLQTCYFNVDNSYLIVSAKRV